MKYDIKQRNTINLFQIYPTYGSYLGTIYGLNCVFLLLLNKLYIIHLMERYMFNNNNRTIENRTTLKACGSFYVNIITITFSGVSLSFCI